MGLGLNRRPARLHQLLDAGIAAKVVAVPQPSRDKRSNPFRVDAPIHRPPGVALREQPRAEGSNPFRIGIGQQTFRSIQSLSLDISRVTPSRKDEIT